jgi:hypothetical protein
MMRKLKQQLAKLAERLNLIRFAIGRAYRKWKANHKRAEGNREKAREYTRKADLCRRLAAQTDDPKQARKLKRQARRHQKVVVRSRGRAEQYGVKARWWIQRIKDLKAKQAKAQLTADELNRRLDELERDKVRFHIENNKVTGGKMKDRWIGTCLLSAKRCATAARANFYSQPGSWNVSKVFTGESWGERSDCSQWVTSVAKACDLDDPNGGNYTAGGYTGTMLGGHGKWRETNREKFMERGWGYVVYGTGTGFHTEAYIGGTRTIGHGDAQINEGYLDMFYPRRYFIYN